MNIREFDDEIQNRIIAELDTHSGYDMGQDLIACIALSARLAISKGKPDRFLIEFAESIQVTVKNWITFAERIMSELYPLNSAYWPIYDEQYNNQVEKSVWLKNQELINK